MEPLPQPTPVPAVSWKLARVYAPHSHCEYCAYEDGVVFSAFGQEYEVPWEDRESEQTAEEPYGRDNLAAARDYFRNVFRQFAAAMAPDKDVEQVLDGVGL